MHRDEGFGRIFFVTVSNWLVYVILTFLSRILRVPQFPRVGSQDGLAM